MHKAFLSVEGATLTSGEGKPISLRGYNVGGWLNMENFLTGYPSSESNFRAALKEAFGPSKYDLFFETFYESFFGDEDAAYLSSLGMNSVRIPLSYRHFEDDERPFVLKEEGFRELDRAIDACSRNGLYVILDLHAVPGSQNQHWHSDNSTHVASFWRQPHFQDRATNLWEAIADRYKDCRVIAGYNLLNEPGDQTGVAVKPFYDRTIKAIRAIDSKHVIFLDGNRYATDFSPFAGSDAYPNVVFAAHDYKLPGFADGGPYPGITRGVYVDREQLRESFLQRTEFMRTTGTPIWIGECGPLFPLQSRNLAERYSLLADQLDIYNQHGAGWALWAYKDVGGQGLVYAGADSPWMQRMIPIVDKKRRLGVDGWGSTDEHIREVMAPIEGLFDREFPGFNPYPFGRADWLAILVRQIMFAEPMLRDVVARLVGPWSDAEIVALAQSFKFSNCVRRSPLADILQRAAAAPVISSR